MSKQVLTPLKMSSCGLSGAKEKALPGYEKMVKIYLNNLLFNKSIYNFYAISEHTKTGNQYSDTRTPQ